MNKAKLDSFVVGTQRGYAYGLVDENGTRYLERYSRVKSWASQDIDAAYRFASSAAATLLYTLKQRPSLLKLSPMPGNLWDMA